MAQLNIRPNVTNLSGDGEIQLLYEAVDFPEGATTTGDTITTLNIFFNDNEVSAGTDDTELNFNSGAELFAFGGDTTSPDSEDGGGNDSNPETNSQRSLQLTNIPVGFDGEQVLLTLPVDTTNSFDGSIINFSVSATPSGVDASTIDGVEIEEPPVNQAPTAVTLENAVANIDENTDTTNRIKVADIAIADDGNGTNNISLTGADAASFEVDGTELFLVAGTNLDFETQESYSVTVAVDDTEVGETPDVTASFTLDVTDVDDSREDLMETDIFRFQNTDVPGTYIYAAEEEAQSIRENFPNFEEEGFAFQVAVEPGDDLIAINRFQSTNTPGTYLFAGPEESVSIRDNFSESFVEEGLAFYVYGVGTGQETELTRFQNEDRPGTYLFAGPEESVSIRDNFPNFIEEGAAFEVDV